MKSADSASKRSVASPAVTTLSNALASGGKSTPKAIPTLPDMLREGRTGGGKNGGKSRGLATKSGYDVKTRVSFGGGKK